MDTKEPSKFAHKRRGGSYKPKMTNEERRAKYTKIARDRRDKARMRERNKNIICFHCRRRGHTVQECTWVKKKSGGGSTSNGSMNNAGRDMNIKICYKCGSSEHSLNSCPKICKTVKYQKNGKVDYSTMDLPYATCFICGEKGHLSGQCKKNTNGIYIKGGCCKICGSKNHLSSNCPKKSKGNDDVVDENKSDDDGADVEEFLEDDGTSENRIYDEDNDDDSPTTGSTDEQQQEESTERSKPPKQSKRKRVVNF